MVKSLQNLDLADSGNGKPIFFLFRVDAFQSDNFIRRLVLANKYDSISALTDLILLCEDIDVTEHYRSHD